MIINRIESEEKAKEIFDLLTLSLKDKCHWILMTSVTKPSPWSCSCATSDPSFFCQICLNFKVTSNVPFALLKLARRSSTVDFRWIWKSGRSKNTPVSWRKSSWKNAKGNVLFDVMHTIFADLIVMNLPFPLLSTSAFQSISIGKMFRKADSITQHVRMLD